MVFHWYSQGACMYAVYYIDCQSCQYLVSKVSIQYFIAKLIFTQCDWQEWALSILLGTVGWQDREETNWLGMFELHWAGREGQSHPLQYLCNTHHHLWNTSISRQHCRLSICWYLLWVWQILSQKQIQITIWWWDKQACVCYCLGRMRSFRDTCLWMAMSPSLSKLCAKCCAQMFVKLHQHKILVWIE